MSELFYYSVIMECILLTFEFRLCVWRCQWCDIIHTTDEQLQENQGCYFPIKPMLPLDFFFNLSM